MILRGFIYIVWECFLVLRRRENWVAILKEAHRVFWGPCIHCLGMLSCSCKRNSFGRTWPRNSPLSFLLVCCFVLRSSEWYHLFVLTSVIIPLYLRSVVYIFIMEDYCIPLLVFFLPSAVPASRPISGAVVSILFQFYSSRPGSAIMESPTLLEMILVSYAFFSVGSVWK